MRYDDPMMMRCLRAALTCVMFAIGLLTVRAAPLETLTFETEAGPKAFLVEVAASPEQREVGLMYRRSLPADHGMLFDFGRVDEVSMWMKNTYVSLDMVFVRPDGRVARIEERTEPHSTRILSSGEPVRYVVELLAGSTARIGLKPGDRVVHPRVGG